MAGGSIGFSDSGAQQATAGAESELCGFLLQRRGSKDPIFQLSGPKNHTLNGFWSQSPSILGTWTFWVVGKVDW